MNNIEGKRLWCRATEEKIIKAWIEQRNAKLSVRDRVLNQSIGFTNHKVVMMYRLWNTNLVERFDDDIYIHISGNMEERERYYNFNGFWQPKEYIISNTTKSRLNAFLDYYGFNTLEVHSSMKDWSVKYNGELLEVDKWYKLDFTSKKLVKVEKTID